MRNTAFLAVGIALLVIQSNLYRLIGRLQIAGITPSLLLPLVVFMGVHEYSIARGAALAFLLGYLLDLFSASPIGLFTFITVATFVVARAAGVRLAAQTLLTKVALAFAFALLEGVLIIVLTAIFGTDTARPRALATLVAPHAIGTALFAPLVFSLAERVHQATINVPRPGEGGQR
ncbi:rod shape-determining protein MreD [Polyangium sp. 6x1]|uniref:rod shape-determining protein MreD n=1 Tax=Polyangium sp. 6x1 TaxID=3042689 RepID=UPI002482C05A|nr:rod shape-determining protein MreD [Polyangium sp. 6x1]MDI1445876.1 rod shape-determining protein MreD [Polyangium sp. 6x1]